MKLKRSNIKPNIKILDFEKEEGTITSVTSKLVTVKYTKNRLEPLVVQYAMYSFLGGEFEIIVCPNCKKEDCPGLV